MSGLESLDEIQSVTSEGLSRVTLQFDQGLNDNEFESLFQEVQNRFTNLDLPDGTLRATIDDFSTNDFLPVIEVVLHGDIPYAELNRAASNLADQLQTVTDLSGITLIGARDREIAIALDRDRMESLGVSLDEVVTAVEGRNVTIPGGTLKTSSREFLLRTVGQPESTAQFRTVVVRDGGSGETGVIRLGDIATVREQYDRDGTAARFNGRQAISLQIAKVPGGSSVGIIDEVRRRVDRYESTLPSALRWTTSTIPL